jgi:hypothetical protein
LRERRAEVHSQALFGDLINVVPKQQVVGA